MISSSLRTLLIAALCLAPATAPAATWVFCLDAASGDLAAGPHLFGVRPAAAAGLDAWDVPEPPLPPSDYLALAFHMAEPSDAWPDRWHDEFRPESAFADELELWSLDLETDRPGEPVTLTVDLLVGAPSEAEVFLLGPEGRRRMEFPATLTLTPTAPVTPLWVEVHVLDPVPAPSAGFSEVKRMYR